MRLLRTTSLTWFSFRRRDDSFPLLLGAAMLAGAVLLGSNALPATASSVEDLPSRGAIEVRIEDGLLELDVKDAPLADVLRVIAEEAGFDLFVTGELAATVQRSFTRVPLHKGIRLLIGRTPHVMIQKPRQDAEESFAMLKLRVYGTGKGRTHHGKARRGPAPEPKQPGPPAARPGQPSEEQILAQLKNPNRSKRFQAIGLTTKIGDDVASRILQQVVTEDEHPAVRAYAIRTLTGLTSDMSLPTLEMGLQDQDRAVRLEAIRAIGRIDDERAVRNLERLLFDDPDPQIRRFAVQAIGARRDENARSILERAAQDPDSGVRKMVAHTLIKWRN